MKVPSKLNMFLMTAVTLLCAFALGFQGNTPVILGIIACLILVVACYYGIQFLTKVKEAEEHRNACTEEHLREVHSRIDYDAPEVDVHTDSVYDAANPDQFKEIEVTPEPEEVTEVSETEE